MKNLVIITHSSTFHADEVFGCALIKLFWPQNPNNIYYPAINRTLDPEAAIKEYQSPEYNARVKGGNNEFIVLDIGKKLGEENGITYLDHHQDKNLPCAAVLAKNWLAEKFPENAELIERTCRDWLTGVDLHDRGLVKVEDGVQSLSQIISTFLPNDIKDMDFSFCDAVEFAMKHLERCMIIAVNQIEEESIIFAAIDHSRKNNLNYVMMNKYYREAPVILSKLAAEDKIKFMVYPHGRGGWALQTVSQTGVMTPRKLIPLDIKAANFVHAGQFLAIFANINQALDAATSLI